MRTIRIMLSLCLLSGFFGALSGCGADSKAPLTNQELQKLLQTTVEQDSPEQTLTNAQTVKAMLEWTGLEAAQIGETEAEQTALAASLTLIPDRNAYDPEAICTVGEAREMKKTAEIVQNAVMAEQKQPLFINGIAQPIFPYTSGAMESGYSNDDSSIIRYSVYIETNYDTDDDGKLDLVKAVVQMPRAVMNGDYQAATIFEARPYISGCSPFYGDLSELPDTDKDFTIDALAKKVDPRSPKGTSTTQEAAAAAQSDEWYYFSPYEDIYDYEDLDWYDYYLVRGYAVVESAGLGTRNSEGYETCGSFYETDAFKCIIEWLNGKRTAYTDKTSDIAISADWSNGQVGMTGRSYSGTTAFALAATGVDGLKTIVPVSGIASWYEYYNTQGAGLADFPDDQLSGLAVYCAGRYLDEDDWNTIADRYGTYLHALERSQLEHGSDYSDVFVERDATLHPENFKCSALIVHGLNDENVRTKQFEMMYKTLQKANRDVHLLLHQDAHITPVYQAGHWAMTVNGESYDDLLNRWFSHYLYGQENGVEKMPAVLAQNNADADRWDAYDTWEADNMLAMHTEDGEDQTISSDYTLLDLSDSPEGEFSSRSTAVNRTWEITLPEDVTVKGTATVHFKAALSEGGGSDNLIVTAMLVDTAEEEFDAFICGDDHYVPKDTLCEDCYWLGADIPQLDAVRLAPTPTTYKVIAKGWIDLCNPAAAYDGKTARESIVPVLNEFHDYTIYLQPNLYTVKEGHRLKLLLTAYDPSVRTVDELYGVTFAAGSVQMEIPTETPSLSLVGSLLAD